MCCDESQIYAGVFFRRLSGFPVSSIKGTGGSFPICHGDGRFPGAALGSTMREAQK
jgi:hypothetical protein